MTVRNKLLTAEQSLYPHKEHKGAVILLFCAAMKTVRAVLISSSFSVQFIFP